MALQYPQQLDLDKLNVYQELDLDTQDLFNIDGLPKILTFGKHYFTLSFNDSEISNLSLKLSSQVLFEFKDSQGNLIFSDITNYQSINGSAVCYVFIREQRSDGYYDEIANGIGTFTIVGELDNVPERYKGAYNVRLTIPIEIRKNLPNISPILFQSLTNVQTGLSFTETTEADTGASNYERSYINVSASHLETFGGVVDKIELSYRETRAKSNEFKILNTYQISSSVYESNLTETGGLNPISDLQKFPTPRELRRNGEVEFRLRFINADGEFAQDITKNNQDVIVTGSVSTISGSKVIVDTGDGIFVTGSGALIFGTDTNNAVKLDYKPAGSGKFKTEATLEFTPVVGGTEQKSFAVADKAGFVSDIDTNDISESINSAMLASTGSGIFKSNTSFIQGGVGNFISQSISSVIVAGRGNSIKTNSHPNDELNSIINSDIAQITGSPSHNNLILNSPSSNINTTVTQYRNSIVGSDNSKLKDAVDAVIIGGQNNKMTGSIGTEAYSGIIGGKNNVIDRKSRTWIIGMSGKTATAHDTVYVENLDVAGSLNVNQITSSIVTSSILLS